MGESISDQHLQPFAQPLRQAHIHPVVPRRCGRGNVVETWRRKAEERHTLGDVGNCVGRLPANRIGRTGQERLVGRPVQNLVRASCPDVAHLQQEIAPQLRLQVEAPLLRYGRSICLINERDGPLSGWRVGRELRKRQIRPETDWRSWLRHLARLAVDGATQKVVPPPAE